MDKRHDTMESGPGWIATLGGALVLVVLGFGVGLVAGAAFEEPDLVVDHLAGRTTEVALPRQAPAREEAVQVAATRGEAAPARKGLRPLGAERPKSAPADASDAAESSSPQVAAAPPAERAPAAKPKPKPEPKAAPSAARAPAPAAGGFDIQVGAFATQGPAESLAQSLRGQGLPVHVHTESSGGARYKVRVGPVPTRGEADRLAARLKSQDRLPTWVLSRE